ncbi:MAG TPA: DUF4476 domain-containing protein [Bacteroidia bacterium]|jgi:hypothetical protein|nr:DUF4476 domain-containing protein [Bacteroidia bacterium]
MRATCLFICLLIISFLSIAQNNLIVWDENGQKFFLFVDDRQINDSAQTEVKAVKIYDDTCRIRAVFHDRSIAPVTFRVFLLENGKNVRKRDFTYSINRTKNKAILNFVSVNYTLSDTTVKAQTPETRIKSIFTEQAKQKEEYDRLHEIYPEPSPCKKAISDSLFQKKLKDLRENHIEINRLKDAKWFISHFCINALQLKEVVMEAFDYRQNKVKVAEFAYDYMEDHRNFLQIVDALQPGTEKEDLKKFYNKRIEK